MRDKETGLISPAITVHRFPNPDCASDRRSGMFRLMYLFASVPSSLYPMILADDWHIELLDAVTDLLVSHVRIQVRQGSA